MKINREYILANYTIETNEWNQITTGKCRIVKAFNHNINEPEILKFSPIGADSLTDYCDNFNKLKNLVHPYIIQHRHIFTLTDKDIPFSVVEVIEYANAGTLADFLKAGQKSVEVIRLFNEVFDGLQFLHSHAILHRDIKATNILLHRNSNGLTAKIIDIEFLRLASRAPRSTPEFLAPEVTLDDEYTVQAEIWAIGIMLYELFSGKFPFGSRLEGLSIATIRNNARNFIPDQIQLQLIPYPLRKIVEVALKKDKTLRAKSISDIQKMLPCIAI